MAISTALQAVAIALSCFELVNAYPLVPFTYHNHQDLTERLTLLANTYPNTTHLYTIGKSVEGRQLWVMAVGKQPTEHVPLRPNIKFVGSIHGDEAPPKEILLHFIEYILSNYGKNDNVTSLLDSSLVHVLPSMNPDGLTRARLGDCFGLETENANGVDLNRNYPDFFHPTYRPSRQPETAAVMNWMQNKSFVLSASLHMGALLVNVPYDNYEDSIEDYSMPAPTPDDDVFGHLAMVYSMAHPAIHLESDLCGHEFHEGSLRNGIINGAEWYATNGTMQDYNYVFGSCMELTLELGCCKYPKATQLIKMWSDNRDALIRFAHGVNTGVRGLIVDEKSKAVTDATVKIEQRMPVNVSSQGEFWKLLLPSSNYFLEVTRAGRRVWRQNFMVVSGNVTTIYINLGDQPPVAVFNDSLATTAAPMLPEKENEPTRTGHVKKSDSSSVTPRWPLLLKLLAVTHSLLTLGCGEVL